MPSTLSSSLGLVFAVGAALAQAGCTDDSSGTGIVAVVTAISVDPLAFLGDVPCSEGPGAMQSYVATITDVTDPDAPFTLPSTPPIRCSTVALFRYVIDGHVYVAEVDGYDVPASDLAPLAGNSSGARQMQEASSPDVVVTPRWKSSCETPTAAVQYSEETIGGCTPLVDNETPQEPAIVVDITRALGALSCEQVGEVSVAPVDPALPAFTATCEQQAEFSGTLVADTAYGFTLQATIDGTAWVAHCVAVAKAGQTVTASCDSLSSKGAINFAVDDVTPAGGPTCGDGVDTFEVQAYGVTVPGLFLSGVRACTDEVRFAPLDPGFYGAKVIARDTTGTIAWTSSCLASVSAAETARCLP